MKINWFAIGSRYSMKTLRCIIVVAAFLIFSGCALDQNVKANINPGTGLESKGLEHSAESGPPIDVIGEIDGKCQDKKEILKTEEKGEEQEAENEISPLLNDDVQWFVDYFSNKKRENFSQWMYESMKFIPKAKQIFRENEIPEDLAYLMIIESGGNPNARSKANAVGLWQFIKGTAVRYGLRVDKNIDERKDPAKATVAAARYLKDLYALFGDWDLALAGYNCGEERVASAMESEGSNSFWELKTLPGETRKYVPAFYAAMVIANERDKYGFNFEDPPTANFNVASNAVEQESVKGSKIRDDIREKVSKISGELSANRKKDTMKVSKKQTGVSSVINYLPRKGDTLWKISTLFKIDMAKLKEWNKIGKDNKVLTGKPLKIYLSAANSTSPKAVKQVLYHKVKKGQTLWDISRKYGVEIKTVLALNKIRGEKLLTGSRLLIIRN